MSDDPDYRCGDALKPTLRTPPSADQDLTCMLRIGVPGDYRPFAIAQTPLEDAEDNALWKQSLQGLDIDLGRALASATGLQCTFIRTTWPTLSSDLASNRFDAAAGGLTLTEARRAEGLFLPGYAPFRKTALVRSPMKSRFPTPADMDEPDVRVIVNPGGTNEKWVTSHFHRAHVTVVDDNASIPSRIAAGEGDIMITDAFEARWYAQNIPGLTVLFDDQADAALLLDAEKESERPADAADDEGTRLASLGSLSVLSPLEWKAFLISKRSPALYMRLLSAWRTLEADGTLAQIAMRWLAPQR